ncbi:MAG: response regulator [Deltaproteobacteria bacterium]|nr:response regulator [Deltaproteobacteria bacterium]
MEEYTVLVVEDDPSMARVLEAQLKIGGYRILKAFNGDDGLKMALEYLPDLILSDIMMPIMDGYDLCRNLKHNPKTWHIPVILLSAKSDRTSVIHSYSVGAVRHLTKPMKKEELFKAIDQRLKYADKARQLLARKASELEGELGRIGIFKIIDLFSLGGWSGYIELRSETGQKGTLYMEDGVIDKCSLEGQFSPYNLFLLLSWEKGTFKAHRL